MLLAARGVAKAYGAITVLDDVSLGVEAGERVGLVGANGAGKTTLLRLLVGQEAPEGGAVAFAPGVEVGYLPQTVPDHAGRTVADLVREAVGHLERLERRMRELEAAMADGSGAPGSEALLDEYGRVAGRFQDAGGYELDHRMEAVLAGLRLAYLPRDRAVALLSGGEKARVGLATLLLRAPDVLLLDEPTNHLDLAALEWLEGYLEGYPGGVLVVSHDRQFLNRTVNRICEVDDRSHGLRRYEGDYDAYVRAKVQERVAWEEDYGRQQEEIKALRRRVRESARAVGHNRPPRDNDKSLYHAKGQAVEATIARNVRAADELLRRIEADPIPRPPRPMRFNPRFRAAALRSREIVALRGVGRTLGGRAILRGIEATVGPAARIALVGPNGSGKTTLLRLIAGLDAPDAGAVRLAPGAQLGYLPQEPAAGDPRRTVLEAYAEGQVGPESGFIAGLIGHGFFRLEDVEKRVGQLSAGQRRKLEIARLVAAGPNVLLLDEPTNYVSLDVLEAFEGAVLAFPGPVIAASHDRWFLERFGGHVWELAAGRLIEREAGSAVVLSAGWGGDEGQRNDVDC
jgi:macrolide transport system ATP-binding/permease protein